ncbi:MAG: hypothetical protein IJT78_02310 [Oscillospiraceae bacterium]|nr:hypothetical protein [Oscillospiraceae bacterium]
MATRTALEVVRAVDALLPNQYDDREKLRWLTRAEGFVTEEILRRCEGGEDLVPPEELQGGEELRVLPPYDELYRFYLERCIHYANGDMDLCNNAVAAWNSAFSAFRDHWFRTHTPCAGAAALRFC